MLPATVVTTKSSKNDFFSRTFIGSNIIIAHKISRNKVTGTHEKQTQGAGLRIDTLALLLFFYRRGLQNIFFSEKHTSREGYTFWVVTAYFLG